MEAPRDLESAEEILEALINKSQTTNRTEESKSQNANQEFTILSEEVEYNRIKNFWYAYEALAGDVQKLEKGIELAIEMQKKTMTEGIKKWDSFRESNHLFSYIFIRKERSSSMQRV